MLQLQFAFFGERSLEMHKGIESDPSWQSSTIERRGFFTGTFGSFRMLCCMNQELLSMSCGLNIKYAHSLWVYTVGSPVSGSVVGNGVFRRKRKWANGRSPWEFIGQPSFLSAACLLNADTRWGLAWLLLPFFLCRDGLYPPNSELQTQQTLPFFKLTLPGGLYQPIEKEDNTVCYLTLLSVRSWIHRFRRCTLSAPKLPIIKFSLPFYCTIERRAFSDRNDQWGNQLLDCAFM